MNPTSSRPDNESMVTLLVDLATDPALDATARPHFPALTRALVDTVAVMIAGAGTEAVDVLHDALGALGSGRSSTVRRPAALPLLDGILVNGVAAHALDFDDTLQGLTTHPSCHLVPALLGLAEQVGASGDRLLTSYLAGLQAEHLLATALAGRSYKRGWHTTQTAGTVATAVAAARLLELNRPTALAAVNAAASSAAGLRANFGSMVKPLHAGHAARNGAEAALLARAGLTSSPDCFEHRFGLFSALTGDVSPGTNLPVPLDVPVMDRLSFKPYPCCGEAIGAVEASVRLHGRLGARRADLVEVRIGPFAREMLEFDLPRSPDEARFSATYCVARALANGRLAVSDFSADETRAIGEDELAAVTVLIDPDLGHERAADVRVRVDGEWLTERVTVPRGDPSVGFDDEDVRTKWRACVDGILANGDEVIDRLLAVAQAAETNDLLALVATGIERGRS